MEDLWDVCFKFVEASLIYRISCKLSYYGKLQPHEKSSHNFNIFSLSFEKRKRKIVCPYTKRKEKQNMSMGGGKLGFFDHWKSNIQSHITNLSCIELIL